MFTYIHIHVLKGLTADAADQDTGDQSQSGQTDLLYCSGFVARVTLPDVTALFSIQAVMPVIWLLSSVLRWECVKSLLEQ